MALLRVPVTRNPKYVHNGLKSLVYTYNKYNITPHSDHKLSRTSQGLMMKRADGTTSRVTATDQQNDSLWTCPVDFGTPAQTLNLDFDSGSSDLWVLSTEMNQSQASQGKQADPAVFDPSQSTTFEKVNGSTWKISYGDGSSASGDVGKDVVKVGDITIQGQAVEVANTVSAQFQSGPSSGLLGLAFGNINTVTPNPVATPLENMKAQNDIPKALFTAYLTSSKDASTSGQGNSFYTFGAIDDSVIPAGKEIVYTQVDNSQGFWAFDSATATVNGNTIQLAGNKAIADTGTTLLLAPTALVEAFYKAIPGATNSSELGGWVIPAKTQAASLPKLAVAVGSNQMINIAPELLLFAPADQQGTMTFGGLQDVGNLGMTILGDVFLENTVAVFDADTPQFGCVQRDDTFSSSATQK